MGVEGKVITIEKTDKPLTGCFEVPGDKSISHRAAIIASLAIGESTIDNYAPGADCQATLNCLRNLGVKITTNTAGKKVTINGKGLRGYIEPSDILYAGNSGTTMRLLSGVLSGVDMFTVITGDDSLKNRPMGRVVDPLRNMGADIRGRQGGKYAPLSIKGGNLTGKRYMLFNSSAQVKSCMLLAALFAEGETTIIVPEESRDHTERLLKYTGVGISKHDMTISIGGPGMRREPKPFMFTVPGDLSSAAFLLAAAAIVPGSSVKGFNVGVNPTRTGFLDVLKRMGALMEIFELKSSGPEPVAEIALDYGELTGFYIREKEVPNLIDEIPVLAVIATQATSQSVIEGIDELKVKESNRVQVLLEGLKAMGADIEEIGSKLIIKPSKLHGAAVDSHNDHRMAMSFAVAALIADGKTDISGFDSIDISYPGFTETLMSLMK